MSLLTFSIDLKKNNIFENYTLLETLLKNGILTEKSKIEDKSLIEYIITNKRNYTLETLIKQGFDVNTDCDGRSPLYISVWKSNFVACKLLIENGANVNYRRETNGTTPLYKAVDDNYTKVIPLLLQAKADPNICSKDGASPILMAVQNNNQKSIKMLLGRGVDLNVVPSLGITPLYMACQYDFYETVRLLLDNNADPNIDLRDGYSLLNVTVSENNYRILQLLIDSGIDLTKGEEDGASLFAGIENFSDACIRILIENGYELDVQDSCGLSPLHYAVKSGNYGLVLLLLKGGADVNCVDDNNLSPLYVCALTTSVLDYQIMESLLEAKADPNIKIKNSVTSITNPIFSQYFSSMTKIINNKIDCDTVEGLVTGSTALYIASTSGNLKMVKILLKAGADPNIRLSNGKTALFACVYTNNYKIASLLLKHDADPDYPSNMVRVAGDKNYIKCVKLLRDAKDKKLNKKMEESCGESCPICLEEIEDKKTLFMTKCYHVFHIECWKKCKKDICPICRQKV